MDGWMDGDGQTLKSAAAAAEAASRQHKKASFRSWLGLCEASFIQTRQLVWSSALTAPESALFFSLHSSLATASSLIP